MLPVAAIVYLMITAGSLSYFITKTIVDATCCGTCYATCHTKNGENSKDGWCCKKKASPPPSPSGDNLLSDEKTK